MALLDDHQTVDTTPATEVPVVPRPPANDDAPTTLAKGQDVEVAVLGGHAQPGNIASYTLNVDAEEQDGEVTGEFRVNNVVVTLQCADADTSDGEIRLGGEVTDDPDSQGLAVDVAPALPANAVLGDRLALIIREGGPDGGDRVALYADDGEGSCAELVRLLRLRRR